MNLRKIDCRFNDMRNFRSFYPLINALVFIIFLFLVVTFLHRQGYGLTYSSTASMPKGFYLIIHSDDFKRNDIVEFKPPNEVQAFVAEQHWAPKSGLLLKHVMGVPGDFVCNSGGSILVNHQKVGSVYEFYAPNKKLPKRSFCTVLQQNQYLLLSDSIERSFDSRYFGPVDKGNIIGKSVFYIEIL